MCIKCLIDVNNPKSQRGWPYIGITVFKDRNILASEIKENFQELKER
jgi:hypothetical protein